MNNKDVAQKVVDRICELIEQEKTLPWVKPWGAALNTVTVVDGVRTVTVQPTAWSRKGVMYRGSNTWLPAGEYITFKQVQAEGGQVLKGAKGWPVVYWNFLEKESIDPDTGKKTKETVPLLRYYNVFRIEDTTLTQKHHPEPTVYSIPITHEEPVDDAPWGLCDTAEAVIGDYIGRAGNGFKLYRDAVSKRAYYSPSEDYVRVPCRGQYAQKAEYYSTIFHELAHSTGHATRLNRFTGKAAKASFGSEEYSREELIAETTAAAMLNSLGMEEGNSFRNSAAYVKSWASHIKDDPMMYVTAAKRAQDAFDMLMGIEKGGKENAE